MTTLTTKQVAALTGKSVYTVRKWINNGSLPAERFPKNPKGRWYIQEEDVPTYLRKP